MNTITGIVTELRRDLLRRRIERDGVPVRPDEVCPRIGVDTPGVVDDTTGVAVLAVNLGWKDVPVRDLLQEALGVPVSYGHDVRSGAWAESRWGAGSADSLYLALGTGIAGVVVLGGRPVVTGGWAGEIGQVLVPDPDRPGLSARFEAVSSAGAIARRYAATRPGAERDEVVAAGALGVQRAMEAGDPVARRVWDTALDATADVVAHTVCLLGPLDVVVGGGLMRAGEELLFEPLRRRVADRLVVAPTPRIAPARLGPWAQALGSAGRALEDDARSAHDATGAS